MKHLNPVAASAYLLEKHGFSRTPVTLRNLRHKGGGPQFLKAGNEIFYRPDLLDDWVESRLSKPVSSTSELPARHHHQNA
ncbi:hypothetical protein [Mesorhizobium sp.]|uniref:hypothetical protein n=1 Tax=Mesorhizobium sp. TaxID=1871066 RepID=UPI00121649AF|nr:hypothetical protein [Mesorhizobium sp.]TIL49090.1 MAG: hypothetical protein E5Y83_28225 [Mesorhizobium sp.]